MPTHRTRTKQNGNGQHPDPIAQAQFEVLSAITSRAQLAAKMGTSFAGDRNIYTAAGYPTNISYKRYYNRYQRQDIAKRIVNSLPDATWRLHPQVIEDQDPEVETEFEKAFEAVLDRIPLFHYCRRVDRLAGIGRYAVLFLGLSDGSPGQEISGKNDLLYLQVYSEDAAGIGTWVTGKGEERFGLPMDYNIQASTTETDSETFKVHHSRVVHVADDTVENDVYGTPRLEAIYNRLQDLETTMAGSTEAQWQAGFFGMAFQAPAGVPIQSESAMEDEIEEYYHGLRRYLRLKGVEAKPLTGSVSSPKDLVDMELKLISGATGIPLRILTGSERGELSSVKDDANWRDRVDERRLTFAEPFILREMINRMIEAGVLPEPKDGYSIEWPDLVDADVKESTEIARITTESLAKYIQDEVSQLIPPMAYLTKIIGISEEEAIEMLEEAERMIEEEDLEASELEEEAERLIRERGMVDPAAPPPVPPPISGDE